jgi:HTH-type transcriptional regulator / antitoxin HigA
MVENAFRPDWIEPPGATISAILQAKKMSSELLAVAVNRDEIFVRALIAGDQPIGLELAQTLSKALGSTAAFWMRRERIYREAEAESSANQAERMGQDWISRFPVSDMVRQGWLAAHDRATRLHACLSFFGVRSVDEWHDRFDGMMAQVAFRTSETFKSSPEAVIAWLTRGERVADNIVCKPWDARKFERSLSELRGLSRQGDPGKFLPVLEQACAECGVALVVERAPTGCRASGATRFINNQKALMMLSGRHLSDDHFWFSFFHESAHLLLHGERGVFVELKGAASSEREDEANRFAEKILIPSEYDSQLLECAQDFRALIRLAHRIGISRGVLVGQMQHRGIIPHSKFNQLKLRYQWT